MLRQKLEYIHNNPVKRGYVSDPTHWRYSSARNYAKIESLVAVTTDWCLCELRRRGASKSAFPRGAWEREKDTRHGPGFQ
jgi:hypothetical protein